MTNKAASENFGIPRNTISTWTKNKNKVLQSLEQALSNAKKLRRGDYEQVDKPILKWLFLQRSQNIPIDGTMTKQKAVFFAEKFNFGNIKASDCWIDKSRKGKEKYATTVNKTFIFLT